MKIYISFYVNEIKYGTFCFEKEEQIVLSFIGTVGPNPYGEDPKNRMPYQAQPASVNVTVNVSREEVKVAEPVAPAVAPEEEKVE